MMVHSRRCRAVRLCLFVPFTRLLAAARRTQVLWFPLDPGDAGARGTVVSQGLRAQRKRKATLQALAGTVRLLVVLMEEVVKLPPSGAFATFHAIRRAGTGARRLLHQQLLAHHTPSTVRGELTFSYMAPLTGIIAISRRTEENACRIRVMYNRCTRRTHSCCHRSPFTGPIARALFDNVSLRYSTKPNMELFAPRRGEQRRRVVAPTCLTEFDLA